MIAALLVILAFGITTDECPATLDLKGPKAVPAAQSYADCMSRPHLPTSSELEMRRKQCAVMRPQGEKADQTLAWVDHVSTSFAGCETRLRIVRK